MPAKVLMMGCAEGAQTVELSPIERELRRQEEECERRAARRADVPDDWPTFPAGCRWVGHEMEQN